MSEQAAVAEPVRREKTQRDSRPKPQPRYQVILWNDEDHSHFYVITMMSELFGHPVEKGYQIACEVDSQGRCVVLTTTREHAELKRDQIHAYGRDPGLRSSQGSMWATIEPIDGA